MVVAEFIPEDDTRQSSAPSSSLSFSSTTRVVGLPYLTAATAVSVSSSTDKDKSSRAFFSVCCAIASMSNATEQTQSTQLIKQVDAQGSAIQEGRYDSHVPAILIGPIASFLVCYKLCCILEVVCRGTAYWGCKGV